MYLGIRMDPFE